MFRVSKRGAAFTLVELLVVGAIISLLIALLLPALRGARGKVGTAACVGHLRQFGSALLLYVADNQGIVPSANPRCPDGGGGGNDPNCFCPVPPAGYGVPIYHEVFTAALYDLGYLPTLGVYKCPNDPLRTDRGGPGHLPYFFPDQNQGYGYNMWAFGTYWDPPSPSCSVAWVVDPKIPLARVAHPAQTYWVADNTDINVDAGGGYYANYIYTVDNVWRHQNGPNMLWVDGHVTRLSTRESIEHGYYAPYLPGYTNLEDWYDIY